MMGKKSKKCSECFGKNERVLEGGVKLSCCDTPGIPIMIRIFQRDAVSSLLLVIALIPLKHILRRANLGYEFRTGETNDLMMYSKSKKALDSLTRQ